MNPLCHTLYMVLLVGMKLTYPRHVPMMFVNGYIYIYIYIEI